MKIATGYFAKAKQYSDMGYALVSISLKKPWFLPSDVVLQEMPELAPTQEILALKGKPDEYEKQYRLKVLAPIYFPRLWDKIELAAKLAKKDKVVLLCWEAPEKFCHRHIVSKYFNEKFGVDIHEVESVETTEQDRLL